MLDPVSLIEAPHQMLAETIKSSGYFNQKSKKLKALSAFLLSSANIDRKTLLNVWGLGPETVDSILLYAYDTLYFVIDAYTKRLFSRLGFCDENITYHELQEFLVAGLPKDLYIYKEYHALIVMHTKEHCVVLAPYYLLGETIQESNCKV